MNNKKNIILFFLNDAQEVHLVKDVGAFLYYLGKLYDWNTSFAYFADKAFINKTYEMHTKLIYLGNAKSAEDRRACVKEYIANNYEQMNYVMLIDCNPGSYKIANICKHYNSNIKVYCKLDMDLSLFQRFYDGSRMREWKNLVQKRKYRNIDWFTVETNKFNMILKDTCIFKNRIDYLPNGISLMDVNVDSLDEIKKENIILTVGRLGTYQKNNELLIEAIRCIPRDLLANWRVYLVGTYTDAFYDYVMQVITEDRYLKDIIIFVGNVSNRMELYKFYAKAKIFTLTSRAESFGIATVEAMCFGAYPILTNFGPVAEEIVHDIIPEKLINYDDIQNLKDNIMRVMDNYDESSDCVKIKKYAREKFSYSMLAGKLNDMLLRL